MHRGKKCIFYNATVHSLALSSLFLRARSPTAFVINSEQRLKKGGSVVFRKFMSVIFHAPRILTRRARSEAPLVTRIHPRRTLQFRLFALRLQ
jgi:hypothetical protein